MSNISIFILDRISVVFYIDWYDRDKKYKKAQLGHNFKIIYAALGRQMIFRQEEV